MLAVSPNSSIAAPSVPAPSSPLASVVNNATDASGAPVFAQVVRDALNRTINNGVSQQSPPAKTPDCPSTSQSQSPSGLSTTSSTKDSAVEGITTLLKPIGKQQGKQSSKDSQSAAVLSTFLSSISQPLSPQVPSAPTTDSGASFENETVLQTNALDTNKPTSQVPVDASSSTLLGAQLQSQLQSQLKSNLFVISPISPEVSTSTPSSAVNAPNASSTARAAATTASTVQTASADQTTDQALAAAASAAITTAFDGAAPAAGHASPPPSEPAPSAPTATAANSSQKAGVTAQVSIASPNPAQGQLLSSVLQQVADLRGPAVGHLSTSSVAVNLARTTAQSQFAQIATNSVLTSSAAVHTSVVANAIASSQSKAAQSDTLDTHQPGQKQSVAPGTNNHSASRDSSSNHDGQSSSDSSISADSTLAAASPTKGSPSAFSEVLSAASVLKPDAAQTTQTTSAAVPTVTPALSQNDLPVRTTPEAPPPAPSPAPATPLPSLRAEDATANRFVSDAQLTTAANQSEMRIAMQTDKLGAVELHARVSGDQVGAAILVEKRDAHAALAAELPALQQALSDKQLRVGQVALSQGSLSSTGGDAGSHAQSGQRGMGQAPRSSDNTFWTESRSRTTAAWFVSEQIGVFNAQGRLSVQA